MSAVADFIGGALILAGAFFFVVGAVGIYRMPDVFARMHAAGISDTVGAGLLIFGMMFLAGFSLVSVKLAIILGIIFFTSPIATHALAQAALHEGLEPVGVGKKILIGPGAHAEPETIGKPKSKTASSKSASLRHAQTRPPRCRQKGIPVQKEHPVIEALINMVLLTLLAAVTLGIVQLRNLFAVVILGGIYSFLMASVMIVLDAIDVAMTEASVGAGVSTVLFLATLYLTKTEEMAPSHTPLIPLFVAVATGFVLVIGSFALPPFGSADTPANTHIAPYYIENAKNETLVGQYRHGGAGQLPWF